MVFSVFYTKKLNINKNVKLCGWIFLFLMLPLSFSKILNFNQMLFFDITKFGVLLLIMAVWSVLIIIFIVSVFFLKRIKDLGVQKKLITIIFIVFIGALPSLHLGLNLFYNYQFQSMKKIVEEAVVPEIKKGKFVSQIYEKNTTKLNYFDNIPGTIRQNKNKNASSLIVEPKRTQTSALWGSTGEYLNGEYTVRIKLPAFTCILLDYKEWKCAYWVHKRRR